MGIDFDPLLAGSVLCPLFSSSENSSLYLYIQASFPPPRNHAAAVAMCREHSNFEVNE